MSASLRAFGLVGLTIAALSCSRDVPTTPSHRGAAAGPSAAADRLPDQPSGVLSVCKQAGAGLSAGQVFTFRVTLSAVSRLVSVAAGSCVQLDVPREGAPAGKGDYRANPDAIARLVPVGTKLVVDAAALSAEDVQAILDGSNVTVASSLLLNLAQQLITADLNVLRGVQPSAETLQAIADANAAIHITVGTTPEITTSLTPAQMSDLVDLLSRFNEGKTKPPAPAASADLQIVETIPALSEVATIACNPVARCSSINTGAGSVTATVVSGETTIVTYTNKARPVLRVCKVAGPGIDAGTVFRIGAVSLGINGGTTNFDVPAGECRDAALAPGSYFLQEVIPANTAVSAITCDPASRCGTPIVPDGVVSANVVDASTTTVTYTNRSMIGTLRVCKVAGAGIQSGTVFRIGAVSVGLNPGTTNFDVPAGECREASVREGSYVLQEVIPSGTLVSAISCDPSARCAPPVLSGGVVGTNVVAQSITTVTYTNRSTIGTLRVCKVAGPGISEGTVFRIVAVGLGITTTTTNFDVPAGACREAALAEGTYFMQEVIPAGVAVSSISCEPAAACSPPQVLAGVVSGSVSGGSTTTVTYTNRSTLGVLRVCKFAGPGIAAGTVFRIGAVYLGVTTSTTNFDVPAGECREASVVEGTYVLQEVIPTGTAVSAITCDPAARCATPILTAGVVSTSVVAQSTTTVNYTNISVAVLEMPADTRLAPAIGGSVALGALW